MQYLENNYKNNILLRVIRTLDKSDYSRLLYQLSYEEEIVARRHPIIPDLDLVLGGVVSAISF